MKELDNKPENERRKKTVIAEIKNYIKMIRIMAVEVIETNLGSNKYSCYVVM